MPSAEITIIIPFTGEQECTLRTLRSLRAASTRELRIFPVYHSIAIPHLAAPYEKAVRSLCDDIVWFPGAFDYGKMCNLGVKASGGQSPFFLFLNNDTYLPPGSLDLLLSPFEQAAFPRLAATGPCSNGALYTQLIQPLYNLSSVPDQCFSDFYRNHRAQWQNKLWKTNFISGFCMLVKSDFFLTVGGFTEGYLGGQYEDLDLCMKLTQEGFEILIVREAFVHHDMSRTYRELGISPDEAHSKNARLYHEFHPDFPTPIY